MPEVQKGGDPPAYWTDGTGQGPPGWWVAIAAARGRQAATMLAMLVMLVTRAAGRGEQTC